MTRVPSAKVSASATMLIVCATNQSVRPKISVAPGLVRGTRLPVPVPQRTSASGFGSPSTQPRSAEVGADADAAPAAAAVALADRGRDGQ